MKNEKELILKFAKLIKDFQQRDDNNEWFIWDILLEKHTNLDNGDIIKTKIHKLLEILNKFQSESLEDYEKIRNMDIETELWYFLD